MTAMTSQEFNRYTGRAKTLAQEEPVFITDRGRIQYVLMSIDDYQALRIPEDELRIGNPFSMGEEQYFEFEFSRAGGHFRDVDFS